MWRLTHNEDYRDAAWDMAESINRHCRGAGGFSSIKRVDGVPTEKIKIQSPHFLSGTLKFLYLIFCEDNAFPLDQWLWNSNGHMFPIRGSSVWPHVPAGRNALPRPVPNFTVDI